MKLCKDCKRYEAGSKVVFDKCARKRDLDIVRGEEEPRFCMIERNTELKEFCGRDARFFEPRESA